MATSSLSAQMLTGSISGTVTNASSGSVVANAAVSISAFDSSIVPVFIYNNTVYTNANGYYVDNNIAIPTSAVVVYTVSTTGCGMVQYNAVTVTPNGGNHTSNFVICNSSATCNAAFVLSTQGSTITATNQSTGTSPGTPITSNWTINGPSSASSALSNPTFGNLANGSYVVCLTITDGTGCSDSWCDSVYVSGSSTACNAAFAASPMPNTPCGFQFDLIQIGGYSGLVWDFGDGNTLTGPNISAPSHTYAASGTYMVTLAMYNNGAICATDSTFITVNCGGSTFNTIAGTVSKSAPGTFIPANAAVYLIEYDAVAGTLTALDTTVTDSMGYYSFSNVATGDYYVKAALTSADVDYTGYLPTYFGQVLFWNQATYANFNSNNNISMTGGNNPGGPGFIGGLVSQGANKTAGVGDPLADLTVLLTDVSDNPIAYKYTDVNGQYGFSNLAYGTYKVWIDILNKTCYPLYVTISAASSSVTSGNFDVNSTYITAIKGQEIAGSFGIYPNPVQNALTITMKEDAGKVANVKVLDMMGRVVMTQTLNQAENTISVSELPTACYILLISTEKGSFTQKIVKE